MIDQPEQLSAYLDGELTDVEAATVEAHLNTCSDCRDELEGLNSARSALRGLPLLTPPSEIFDLRPEPAVPLSTYRRAWVPVAAAVAALVVWAGITTGPPGSEVAIANVSSAHATTSAGQQGVLLISVPLEGVSP